MKIAIVGPFFRPQLSGIEKIMDMHARMLAQRGHDVRVITSSLRFPDGKFDVPDYETVDGFAIHRIPVALRSLPRPLSYPSNGGVWLPRLRSALHQFAPDVIHAHNVGAPAWANGAARFAKERGLPFFYSTYHHPDALKLDWVRKVGLRMFNHLPLRLAHRIYHLTRSDFEKLLSDYPCARSEAFAVLPPGVVAPLEKFAEGAVRDGKRLLFVGRVDDQRKGFAVLEAAFDALRAAEITNLSLVVVGMIEGTTRERLSTKYGPAIRITGIVDEAQLERHYAAAGIFVMPSYYEGFGMPYIEAMRYAVPVIGTNVGGIPEVVPEGTGVLVAPGDPQALAAAIRGLIESPGEQERIGTEGQRWSKSFFWPRIVDQLERDYQDSLL